MIKFRDNLFLGDLDDVGILLVSNKNDISAIVLVDTDLLMTRAAIGNLKKLNISIFKVGLQANAINKPHVKDIACHIPKYMIECGEKVLIISDDPSKQASFVACRAICELEQKTIYEIMLELKSLWPDFDIGAAYL